MKFNEIITKYKKNHDVAILFANLNSFISKLESSVDETELEKNLSLFQATDWINMLANHYLLLESDPCTLHIIFKLSVKNRSEVAIAVIQYIVTHPEIAKDLYESGDVILESQGYIRSLLDDYLPVAFQSASEYKGKINPSILFEPAIIATHNAKEIFSGLEADLTLNRTLLFRDPCDEKFYRACKIKKVTEDVNDLSREYQMLTYLRANRERLKLKSTLPEPIGVYQIENVLQYVPENIRDIIEHDGNGCICYVYDAPKEYFSYIHAENQSTDTFVNAFKNALHDIAVLFKEGIVYHQLIDLFHTTTKPHERADGGKYFSILTLLDPGADGQGKLATWMKSVLYPNLRMSGLADFGDMSTIKEIFDYPQKYKRPVNADISASQLVYNFIADFFLIIELIVGCRTRKILDKNPHMDADKVWRQAVTQIIELSTYLATVFEIIDHNGDPLQYASLTDVDYYRKQMQYFMTTEYVADFMQQTIKKDLYPAKMNVSVDYSIVSDALRWDPKVGFVSPESLGNQDLGPYNGAYPIYAGVIARSQIVTYFATKNGLPDYHAGWNKTGRMLFSYAQQCLNDSIWTKRTKDQLLLTNANRPANQVF